MGSKVDPIPTRVQRLNEYFTQIFSVFQLMVRVAIRYRVLPCQREGMDPLAKFKGRAHRADHGMLAI
ncbi:MAG: hypothetical protein DRP71_13370, partial [Verrucomicrobia bacterium]